LNRRPYLVEECSYVAAAQVRLRHSLTSDTPAYIAARLLAGDQLCNLLLTETFNVDLALEQVLIRVRANILQTCIENPGKRPALRPLVLALAHQSFNNDYVFPSGEDEERRVTILLAKPPSSTTEAEWQLLLAGMYRPPVDVPELAAGSELLAPDLAGFITRAIRNPRRERALRATIPTLGTIDDATSRAVQAQYDEHPYPRWVHMWPQRRRPIIEQLRRGHPDVYARAAKAVNGFRILVAGCGTGREALRLAIDNPGADIVACDLSLSALAHARRAAEDAGVDNITFMRADILSLASIGRQFDHVLCLGVLHHIGRHHDAWTILAAWSHLADRFVFAFIAALPDCSSRIYPRSRSRPESASLPQNRFRQFLIEEATHVAATEQVTRVGDFFTTNTTRDLLLHANEHQYTVSEIESIVRACQLQLLSAVVPRSMRRRLKARGIDEKITSFEQFRAIELAYAGSLEPLEFWLRKP
jgi:SAM-dependent methyltransferase